MRTGRPKKREIVLSVDEREQLERYARMRTRPTMPIWRAKAVLMSAAGASNSAIAEALGIAKPTVAVWRNRFLERGVAGLRGTGRRGRPRSWDEGEITRLIRRALRRRGRSDSGWSVRRFAKANGIPKSSVQRYFALIRSRHPPGRTG